MFFNTKAQSAHPCVAVLTPDSLTINESMRHWHNQGCIQVFMQATPHTIIDLSIANLFYDANPAELGEALCDPLCLPPCFEPISAHQLYQFAVCLETLRIQSPGQVLIHPLSKQYTLLQPQTHSMLSFPRQIMQLQVVRPCGHCLIFYISKNHVPSVKTSTQIDLNITHLKEFININININFYIPDLKKKSN